MRASGKPICSAAMVALQAPSIEAKGQTAARIVSGMP